MEAVGPSTNWISLLQWITLRASTPGSVTFMSGISVHRRRDTRACFPLFPPCEDTARTWPCAKPGSRPSPDPRSDSTLILHFSAFRSVRNKFKKLSLSQSVYSIFVIAAQDKRYLPFPWHCAEGLGRAAMQLFPPVWLCPSFTAGAQSDWPVTVALSPLRIMCIIRGTRDTKVNRIHFSSRDFCLF